MTRCNICISKLILLNTVFLGGLLPNKVKPLILKLEVISKIDKGFHYRKYYLIINFLQFRFSFSFKIVSIFAPQSIVNTYQYIILSGSQMYSVIMPTYLLLQWTYVLFDGKIFYVVSSLT